MLRTNSKQAKAYFDNYLSDILDDNFENNIDNMAYQYYASASNSVGKLYHAYKTYQEAFETISQNFGVIYYDEMRNILKEALQETEEEANKFTNEQVANKYNYLLYCAYLRKCEKENINPFKYFHNY